MDSHVCIIVQIWNVLYMPVSLNTCPQWALLFKKAMRLLEDGYFWREETTGGRATTFWIKLCLVLLISDSQLLIYCIYIPHTPVTPVLS